MSKINALMVSVVLMFPMNVFADEAEAGVVINFPIVEKQFPDLQKTIKRPTIVWAPKKNVEQAPQEQGQLHIISPLFYYQETTTKK
tara:strand:- start:400 stop:657 length:258 start_codon:yes stop_codon:yes gene_type:complete